MGTQTKKESELKLRNTRVALLNMIKDANQDRRKSGEKTKELEKKTRELEEKSKKLSEARVAILNMLKDMAEDKEKIENAYQKLKIAQTQLVQSAKMSAIGQLGAGIAHELNNPIGGILGYAQYMLSKMKSSNFGVEGGFKSFKKYLEHIERESSRCKNIIGNLLSFSRKPTHVKLIDIKEVIKSALNIVGHQLEVEKIKITTDFSPQLASTEISVNQFQQVFINFMLNARDAMLQGGELKIVTRNIEDNKIGVVKKIKIEFSDTGCGISEENLSKVFEAFFTTKTDWKGTGLGLTICYQLIKEHKGDIEVTSQLGKGTTFTITLPVKQK